MKYIFTIVLIIILILAVMYFFLYKKDLYAFSAVKGVITMNGEPVDNAQIMQVSKVAWTDQVINKTTNSDKNGVFALDEVITHSALAHILPHEPVIDQSIKIKYKDKIYEAWLYYKGDYKKDSELDIYKSINLKCELNNKLARFDKNGITEKNGQAYGICRIR